MATPDAVCTVTGDDERRTSLTVSLSSAGASNHQKSRSSSTVADIITSFFEVLLHDPFKSFFV